MANPTSAPQDPGTPDRKRLRFNPFRELAFGWPGWLAALTGAAILTSIGNSLFIDAANKKQKEAANNQMRVARTAVSLAIRSEPYYTVTVNSIVDGLDRLVVVVYDHKLGMVSTSNLTSGDELEHKRTAGVEYLITHSQRWEERVPVEGSKTIEGKPRLLAYIYLFKLPTTSEISWPIFVVEVLILALAARFLLEWAWKHWGDRERARSDDLKKLISTGEGQKLEFKPMLRSDLNCGEPRDFQEEALKTICGFLNRDGGQLLVGVLDDGAVIGIEGDLARFSKDHNPKDKLQLHCHNILRQNLGSEFQYLINVSFVTVFGDGAAQEKPMQVLVISCRPSTRPVLYKSRLYSRAGNSTNMLYDAQPKGGKQNTAVELNKALLFCIDHFGERGLVANLKHSFQSRRQSRVNSSES